MHQTAYLTLQPRISVHYVRARPRNIHYTDENDIGTMMIIYYIKDFNPNNIYARSYHYHRYIIYMYT